MNRTKKRVVPHFLNIAYPEFVSDHLKKFMLTLFVGACTQAASGQISQYVSPDDASLTFDDVEILNFDDNVGNAYSKPLTETALQFFEKDRRYHASVSTLHTGSLPELEENTKDLSNDIKLHPRRAYLKTSLVKGPKGLRLRTVFFTGYPVLPLLVSEQSEERLFELDSVKQLYEKSLGHLLDSLPYQARILSRKENRVTLNAGARSGLMSGQTLLVVQVIHIERHPVLHFATQFQREIMGKIKLTKVDDSLSFGDIVFEKTPSLLAPDFKVTFHENVNYESDGPTAADSGDVKRSVPTIGEAELLAGISKIDAQNNLTTNGSVSAEDSTTPTVLLRGQIWLTQNWFSELSLQEYIGQLNNGLSGSTPSSLNMQVMRTNFHAGYRFLMQDDFFGPSVSIGLGYSKTKFTLADSTPSAFTSMDYSSFALVAGGKFPIELQGGRRLYLGGDFTYHLSVGLSESPGSSGSSSSSHIATLDVFGNYPLKENVALTTMVQFDQFSTNFSGTGTRAPGPASSASLNFLSVLGGVLFQF